MSEMDAELREFCRRRMVQLADWSRVLREGTDEERLALVAELREIDIGPLLSTLDEDPEEVQVEASRHRRALALAELRRLSAEAIAAGDLDTAAQWLDLRLSVEDPRMR